MIQWTRADHEGKRPYNLHEYEFQRHKCFIIQQHTTYHCLTIIGSYLKDLITNLYTRITNYVKVSNWSCLRVWGKIISMETRCTYTMSKLISLMITLKLHHYCRHKSKYTDPILIYMTCIKSAHSIYSLSLIQCQYIFTYKWYKILTVCINFSTLFCKPNHLNLQETNL